MSADSWKRSTPRRRSSKGDAKKILYSPWSFWAGIGGLLIILYLLYATFSIEPKEPPCIHELMQTDGGTVTLPPPDVLCPEVGPCQER